MPDRSYNVIAMSERMDRLKRRAADTDCRLPPDESQKFLGEYDRLLAKLEDHVEHTRSKFEII